MHCIKALWQAMIRHPAFRLRLTLLLYFSSALPFALLTEGIPVFLRERGYSLASIGLLSLLQLPWSLKVFLGPIVDRYLHPLAYIRLSLVGIILGELLLAKEMGHLPFASLFALLMVIATAAACQDLAIDGLFVRMWHGAEQPNDGNALRSGMYRLALIVGGGGAIVWASIGGWQQAILFHACCSCIILLACTRLTRIEPGTGVSFRQFMQELTVWLRKPGMSAVVLFIFLYRIGDFLMGAMVRPFWVDRGISLQDIGLANSGLGTLLSIAGTFAGNYYIQQTGLYRALWRIGLLQALTNLLYAGVAFYQGGKLTLYAIAGTESFAQGMGAVALLALVLTLCDNEHSATQHAGLLALLNLSRSAAGVLSGPMTEYMGYASFFALTFFLSLPAFALLPAIRTRLANTPRGLPTWMD